MDFSAIIEEIALEGLEGITLSTLWQRLENRPDLDDLHLDKEYKNFIWKFVSSVQDFRFYCLPEPRPEFVVFKYSDYIFPNSYKCVLPTDTPGDIYSQKMIDDNGVNGCCDHYETRTDVTEEVRDREGTCLLMLDEVTKRWGQCFVIVASQRQRSLTLLGSAVWPSGMGAEIYCVLEAIGRARYEGEITQCRYPRGLTSPKRNKFGPPGSLFVKVKMLVKLGYVTKQPFTLKYRSPEVSSQVRLVHLRRFCSTTKANFGGYMQSLSDYLLNKPNHTAVYSEALKILNLKSGTLKKRPQKFYEYFVIQTANYSELFPDVQDWKTKNGGEKRTKIIRLLKPYVFGDCIDDDDDEDEEDGDDNTESEEGHRSFAVDDDGEEEMDEGLDKKPVPEFGYLSYHRSVLSQIVRMVQKSGEKGIQENELMTKLNLERNVIRISVRELLKMKALGVVRRAIRKMNAIIIVSPEVAESLKKKKDEEVKLEIAEDAGDVTEAHDTLPLPEETSSCPAEEQMTDEQHIKEFDSKLSELGVICTIDRAEFPVSPVVKKEESDKKQERKNFILKELAQKKVFSSCRNLYVDMCRKEKEQGMKERMCRKSFSRILKSMYDEGQIVYVNVYDKSHPDKLIQKMVMEPHTTLEDYRIKEALLQSKAHFMKFDLKSTSDAANKSMDTETEDTKPLSSAHEASSPWKTTPKRPSPNSMVSVCQMLDKGGVSCTGEQKNPRLKWGSYGLLAKFERVELLHKYLFYLLYGYEGCQDTAGQQMEDKSSSGGPPVYLDVDDWRRHLPPLKKHNEAFLCSVTMDGVCMIGDVLLNMPLSLFCKIISIPWEVDGLNDLLSDPVQKNYPITAVPKQVLHQLLKKRKYLLKLNDNLLALCHFGLLTFGEKTPSRELEFISFYLHKRAMILDTRISEPGNVMTRCPEGETFEKLCYNFESIDDVNSYWNDVKVIALSSKVGYYSVVDVSGNHGTISLLEASWPTSLQKISEDDWLPGDRRGSGGFDSSLFVHRNSNWNLKGHTQKQNSSTLTHSLGNKRNKVADTPVEQANKPQPNQGGEEKTPTKKLKVPRKVHPVGGLRRMERMSMNKNRQRKRAQAKTEKKQKVNTEDDGDRQAKMNMRKMRTSFTPLENGLLLLSQVTSSILSPKTNACVRSSLIRDILKELLPESKDKTTNAIKGKLARLLKEDRFRVHLVVYIAQALGDKELMTKYEGKRHPIHSPGMESQFRRLYLDLRNKFSSPRISQAVTLPGSVSELLNQYTIESTKDILYKTPKVSKDVQCVDDVKEIVVWELLESFLHLTKPLSAGDVYITLSRFPDDVVRKAYTSLKLCGIIVQMKKFEKDRKQILNKTALLNNHKSTVRHRDALKPRYPVDLFWNLKGQIEALAEINPIIQVSPVAGDDRNKLLTSSFTEAQSTGSSFQPGKKDVSNSEEQMDADFQVQGTETETLSEGHQRNEADMELDVQQELKDANDENREVPEEAEGNYKSLDLNKFQGGSVLMVLSLMAMDLVSVKAVIPDEMVKLDEEGKSKLNFKQPAGERPQKRKLDALYDSDEDLLNEYTERDSSIYKHHRTGQKHSSRGLKFPRVDRSVLNSNDMGSTSESGQFPATAAPESRDKCLKLKNVSLHMRVLESCASGVLGNFTVWVASGSLLTLARTSLIESLDILNSKCLLQRNFILEPLNMKFMLKPEVFKKPGSSEEKSKKGLDSMAATFSLSDDDRLTKSETDTGSVISACGPDATESTPARSSRNRSSNKEGSRCWFSEESFLDLIHHLGKCFKPDLSSDDMWPILEKIIPTQLLDKGRTLFQVIDSSGDLGIAEIDLEAKVCLIPAQEMKALLRLLVRADAVFRVGIVERRYVSRKHAKVWFVEVPLGRRDRSSQDDLAGVTPDQRNCPTIVYQCRLWRHFNGTLNWQGLQMILKRVLTYLMAHPGCTLCHLCHVLNPDVLPATTMDVVDILEELGCVELLRIPKQSKPTFFSARKRTLDIGDAVSLQKSVTVISVVIDAPVKLAYFFDLVVQQCLGSV